MAASTIECAPRVYPWFFIYLFHILMTFILLFAILNMVAVLSDDLSIYKDVSMTADCACVLS